jgi:hypothetical protein
MKLTTFWQANCREARGLPEARLNSLQFGSEIDEGLARGLTGSRRPAERATEGGLECRS